MAKSFDVPTSMDMLNHIANQLIVSLETRNFQAIQNHQIAYSQLMDKMWTAYRQGNLRFHVREQTLPRTMHFFATKELPRTITTPQRWPQITQELRTFMRTVDITTVAPHD